MRTDNSGIRVLPVIVSFGDGVSYVRNTYHTVPHYNVTGANLSIFSVLKDCRPNQLTFSFINIVRHPC